MSDQSPAQAQGQDQFQYIKLPDGSYGKFAASAGDDVIRSAIQKDFPDAFGSQPTGWSGAGAVQGAKEGANDLIQGVTSLPHALRHPIDTLDQMGQQQEGLASRAKQDFQSGHYGNAFWHGIDAALPVLGPMDAAITDEYQHGNQAAAMTRGAVNALPYAVDPVAPVRKLAGKTIGATGYGVKAAAATPESLSLAGTRVLAKGSPGQLLQSALKPSTSYGAGVSNTLEHALPDVIKAGPGKGVSGFAKAADKAASARGDVYNNWLGPNKNVPVDTSSLVPAQMNSIPLIAETENPGIVGGTNRVANRYVPKPETSETVTSPLVDQFGAPIQHTKVTPAEPPRTLGFTDQIRKDSNQKLHSLYNKTQGDRYAALANPETARTFALNNQVRDLTYKGLSDAAGVPEDAIRDNQNMHSALIDTADIANKREPVFARHDPVTLSQKVAVGHGGPIATAFNWAKEKGLQHLTNSDALVNSAIDRYKNPIATPLYPRNGIIPRAFSGAGQGVRSLGGAIDNTKQLTIPSLAYTRRDQK